MQFYLITIVIGLAAGFFAGQFGVGGAFLMQPALRLLLHTPELVTIGTPIPVIVASSLTGALNYYRSGYIDIRIAGYLSSSGVVGAVLGSLATTLINGSLLLIVTAIVLAVTSVRFMHEGMRRGSNIDGQVNSPDTEDILPPPVSDRVAVAVGAVVGFLAGLLGLGGGYILIPTLTLVFKRDMKTAIGTSLLVIISYAIPGAITHFWLGNVDVRIALLLVAGIVPGAYMGSKIAIGLPEEVLRRGFGAFLFLVSLYFGIFELKNLF